ncbi:unnamed protein product [Ceutorhynchus assimilis]|uniref:Uncharacterized protein n=1 Tax=Ceutorhynchus assimilis TaxID=467358 RepID=A0A9N9QSF9_9CUCU|nr:unnamed protein product [Ceutorhynchus assimilis]
MCSLKKGTFIKDVTLKKNCYIEVNQKWQVVTSRNSLSGCTTGSVETV